MSLVVGDHLVGIGQHLGRQIGRKEDLAEVNGRPSRHRHHLVGLVPLTLPRQPGGEATVNLQGPIVFNVVEQLGKQVVIEAKYGVRYPVSLGRSVQEA